MTVDLRVCDEREVWFEKPERIVEYILEALSKRGCEARVTHRDETGEVRASARCGDCTLSLHAVYMGEMPFRLGKLSELASSRGYGVVKLVIHATTNCRTICESLELLLLRGGG
ncbi:hypothetical protein [Hyperthermus butylicus]|uniref:Uncharacterized protein n=1 Tax=Hyperthermus butylicus (strain DSM 5456 / JCM 9403 / PLM1-5) TaxID=415426 RepID=A2BJD0_HYPBU|nr:hypothetical protein [Hyperthermus butylicus]ABM80091.1 hypothetical protein Hbut_0219 [Hyperthermus butylicus DSM 5456]